MNHDMWDVVVVGGGPAGMMAAGRAAEKGARVVLIEKNDKLGKKLLLTGGGRCNFTNSEFDIRRFVAKYKDDGKFLFSSFSRYGVKETLDFFHERGVETKVENDLRAFPISDSAETILNTLLSYIKQNGVNILSDSPVSQLVREGNEVTGVKLASGRVIKGNSIVIATGGTSYPETGSTGDGYKWLKYIGHKVIDTYPGLVPIITKEKWVKDIAGVVVTGAGITVFQDKKKKISAEGDILFTHTGISGPTILNLSREIGKLLEEKEVIISIDFMPHDSKESVDAKLKDLFGKNDKKKIGNAIMKIIPSSIVPIILRLSHIDEETECNNIKREERIRLMETLKDIPLQADKLFDAKQSIVAGGGVDPKEVDFKTMCSRMFSNLYLAGDILNIDRPSGGYSLQLCFTTGYLAGDSASGK